MTTFDPAFFRHELVSILASLRTVSMRIPENSLDPRLHIILDGTVVKIEKLVQLVETTAVETNSRGGSV